MPSILDRLTAQTQKDLQPISGGLYGMVKSAAAKVKEVRERQVVRPEGEPLVHPERPDASNVSGLWEGAIKPLGAFAARHGGPLPGAISQAFGVPFEETKLARQKRMATGEEKFDPYEGLVFDTGVLKGGAAIGMVIGQKAANIANVAGKLRFMGLEGKPLAEISDRAAKIVPLSSWYERAVFPSSYVGGFTARQDGTLVGRQGSWMQFSGVPLDSILQHDELFKNYPHLRDVRVHVGETIRGAFISPGTNAIFIGSEVLKNPRKAASVLLHEIQHHVQEFEGLLGGGSPNIFYKTKLGQRLLLEEKMQNTAIGRQQKLTEALDELTKDPQGQPLEESRVRKLVGKNTAYNLYRRIPGEIMAFATGRRAQWGEASRANHPIVDTLFEKKPSLNIRGGSIVGE